MSESPTTREEAIRKIIRNQEKIIQGLEVRIQNYKEKGLPELNRLEQRLNDKDQEIESLQFKIKDLQSGYNKEKTITNQSTEKSKGEIEGLRATLQNERLKNERKIMQLEDQYRIRISSLENENKLVTEELVRLKKFYMKENDKDFSNQVNENIKVLDDLKKLNNLFLQKEAEHKGVIQQLKVELEQNLDMFNRHLNKCSQEKRELTNKYLEDLTFLNPETAEFKKLMIEFDYQIKELIGQLAEKDKHIHELNSHLEKMSIASEQVREKYQELAKKDEESVRAQVETNPKRAIEESQVENEKLYLVIKEKTIENENLKTEIETLKIEAQLMEQNLEEIKSIAATRELNALNEIQALKLNNLKLIESDGDRYKLVDEQVEHYLEKIAKLENALVEREQMSQGLNTLMEEIELVHRRLEDISKKQKEFFDREKSPKSNSKLGSGNSSDKIMMKSGSQEMNNPETRGTSPPKVQGKEEKKATIKKSNLASEHKALNAKNTELEKLKEHEIMKHKTELEALQVFWEKCLHSLSPLVKNIDEFYSCLKGVSKKVDHMQKVILPEKKVLDSVHNQINKLSDLVEEYNNIKEEICLKVVHELEIQKYEDKIVKLDQELELAKVSLIHYMRSAEALKNMINTPINQENEENPEIIALEYEVKRLQDQNSMLLENSKKLEEIYEGQIHNVAKLLKTKK